MSFDHENINPGVQIIKGYFDRKSNCGRCGGTGRCSSNGKCIGAGFKSQKFKALSVWFCNGDARLVEV